MKVQTKQLLAEIRKGGVKLALGSTQSTRQIFGKKIDARKRGAMKNPLFLLFSGLVLASLLVACGEKNSSGNTATAITPVELSTVMVEKIILPLHEEVVGTVQSKLQATVAAKVTGRILELKVAPGQEVAQGDEIARIDAGELKATRERARAALQQANQEFERQSGLMKVNATARAAFEAAEAAQKMAAATLAEIEALLDHTIVKAPFSGTVSRKLADIGDMALPGRGIIVLEDPSQLRLEAPVPESLAGTLKLGQSVPVTLAALTEAPIEGKIGEIEPSAESASRTFMVRIELPPTTGLRAGLFGRARFPLGAEEALVAPASTLRYVGQMETVFEFVEDRAHLRLVRTVPTTEGRIRFLSGISAEARLVDSPPTSLADGHPVKTQP